MRRYPEAEFPTDPAYGPTPGATPRLTTCGGDYNGGQRPREDKIVVYATESSG
ncbi:class F sortase [Actinokineospora pegani]|uniref:hypothetical protein n=1 Tax=Actinokineospora pegani TaxID=2654637 RepID=UPI0012EA3B27|nr:hypothetical protein [Actinokineospora pegani]